jgi:hypothetical protein
MQRWHAFGRGARAGALVSPAGFELKAWLAVLVAVLAATGASEAGVRTPAPLQLVVVQPTADTAAAADQVRAAGGRVELTVHGHLQALVPAARVQELSRDPAVDTVAPAPIASADAVTSGGVARIGADALQNIGLRGAGVKIVVLDTAFGNPTRLDTLAPAELPIVPQDHRKGFDATYGLQGRDYFGTYSAHGEEVAELVYDVAPLAQYWYVNYRTADEFGQAFQYVMGLHPDIVVHSNSFLFGPFDGTGWFAKQVDDAAAHGILWVNSAGNYRMKHWEGPWADADADGALDIPGHVNSIPFTFADTNRPACDLSWIGPGQSETNGYTLGYYLDAAGTQPALDKAGHPIVSSFVPTPEPHADIPPAVLATGTGGTYYLRVKRVGNPSGQRLTFFCRQDLPVDVDTTASSSPTPGDARGALSVGAFNVNSLLLQDYSTEGPTDDGRMKPDLAAPTGVAVVGGYFSGTSAAAPHVAGEAALIWSQVAADGPPDVPAAVADRLRALALDMGPVGPDLRWGLGRTRVDATAPGLGATSPAPGSAVAGVVPLRLPLVEAGTLDSTAVSLDGAPLTATLGSDRTLTASFDSRGLADGAHHVTVSASDKSGNVATLDLPLRVDNTAPALGPTQPAAGAPVSGVVSVRLALTDPDGVGSASASVEGAAVPASLAADGTMTASVDTRGVADGMRRVSVRAADRLGNATAFDLPLLVDNTRPQLRVSAAGSVLAGARFRVVAQAADNLAGLAGPTRVRFGDGGATSAPATHRYLRSGRFTLRVTVTDRAGNAAVVTRAVKVVELRVRAPKRGAWVAVTVGRRDVVRVSVRGLRLRRTLAAGTHRIRLGRLPHGRYAVTVEARGFRARTIVRVA